MPFYEYKCCDCNNVFTLLRSVDKKDDATNCPKCGSPNVKRVISRPMVSRAKSPSNSDSSIDISSTTSSSSCAGCSGGDCSSCGL
ncbi:MAG TPA: zinc ribbon domain-containing protein [Thermodesulfobium narugense]|uniref:Putative regulatory protein, FmdB family n=1 Tax=Thermodesulfobium acidiphilum TaxID=1794699 RepID=A0A2R4VZ63_THEAF|nr:zinc ribbon domain-containing protein [Thermodesulfobium acidiphilum]AWB09825.1 putative regulatory protein, FmdB family [Thermodesulfobium acidiphilum]HEM55191.1 zinc ribbon domain-containing protein [Thermodesulfobium narugense]